MNTESAARIISSKGEFDDAVRALLLRLPQTAPRELALCDADLSEWPLNDPAVLAALTTWVKLPGRRLRLLALSYDDLQRRQPRLAEWRRNFAHAVTCQTPAEMEAGDMPCLAIAGDERVELLDRERCTGSAGNDARRTRQAMDRFEAISQRSEAAWPVSVLGL